MKPTKNIDSALAAANSPVLLESGAQAARAAKAWRRVPALGLDTEFVRERTYYANLGLVQVSDGQTVWLLDPLIEGTTGPLKDLLDDNGVLKIFHSPSEDLEVLRHSVGTVPEPMVDTQVACAMLGEPLQLGYHMAVEKLFGIEVDKGLTRSNWCARPLRPELLHYAALDVCLLPQMWRHLEGRLDELGRTGWMTEECARQVKNALHPPGPADAWRRIRGHGRLDGISLAILSALAQWREKVARKRNRPRGFIVPDAVLLTIARDRIGDPEALAGLDQLHPRARNRYGAGMAEIVNNVVASGRTLPVTPQLDFQQKKLLRKLRALVNQKAAELRVEAALLATKKDLEQLVVANPHRKIPERLTGWRQDVITKRLLAAMRE